LDGIGGETSGPFGPGTGISGGTGVGLPGSAGGIGCSGTSGSGPAAALNFLPRLRMSIRIILSLKNNQQPEEECPRRGGHSVDFG
jgi:hypothetical protein